MACGLYGLAGLLGGWESGLAQAVAIALAVLFLYLPGLLMWAVGNALGAGRYRRAAAFAWSRAALQWDAEVRREAALLSAWDRLKRDLPVPGEDGPLPAWAMEPAATYTLRWAQVGALAGLRRHGEATAFFERHLGWAHVGDTPQAACLVRPYAAQGRFREALLVLAALERWRGFPELRAGLLAQTAVLPAYLGRRDLVEEALRQSPAQLPRAYAPTLRGLAARAAGDAAEAYFEAALAEAPSEPSRIRRAVVEARTVPLPSATWALLPAEEGLMERWFSPRAEDARAALPRRPAGRAATALVLLLCGAAFLAGLAAGDGPFLPRLSNLVTFGGDVPALVAQGEWWRLVSAIFLHAGLLHLAVNAMALWIFGEIVENVFGSRGFWVVFLASGIAGTVGSAFVAKPPVAVGASGGGFGLLGAALALLSFRRGIFPAGQRRALRANVLLMIVANLSLGMLIPQVDNTAHLAGLGGGFLAGLLLHPAALPGCPPWQRRLQAALAWLGIAGVGLVAFLAVRNATGAGYPWRPGPTVQVLLPGLGYRMDRPVWWQDAAGEGPAWEDALGIRLVHKGWRDLPPGGTAQVLDDLKRETGAGLPWTPPRETLLGGQRFTECRYAGLQEGATFFLLRRGGKVWIWQVQGQGGWEAGGADAIARRLLATLSFERAG